MKGRYKLIEKTAVIAQGVRATIRIDVWSGRVLRPKERRELIRTTVDWVLHELEPPVRAPTKTARKVGAA